MTKPTNWYMRPAKTQISLGTTLSLCGQRRLRSNWAVAQADLSLRWAHITFSWFCHALARLFFCLFFFVVVVVVVFFFVLFWVVVFF